MNYAPVIIPTLNRYEHLKRCLDSLSKNTMAGSTSVIISVDYPPSERYEIGYKKVVELLEHYDFSSFKSRKLIFQQYNLGASGNATFLYNYARQESDVVIYSEDDNEFSAIFLEYINAALSKFRNDPNVLFVCGSVDTHWNCAPNYNVVKTKFCPAYGIGVWLDRREKFNIEGADYLLDKKNWTIQNFNKLFRRNRYLFSKYICEILLTDRGLYWPQKGNVNFCDVPKAIYMHLSDYTCISPRKPVSRTFGNDGSGTNQPCLIDVEKIDLDDSIHFELNAPDQLEFDESNYNVGEVFLCRQYLNGKRWSLGIILSLIGATMLLLLGRNREKAIKVMNVLYKLFNRSY